MADSALLDLRVLDISESIAGPYCARLLGDFGADVIKVERPALGDLARSAGPFPGDVPDVEKSGLFIYLNQNKRGITLNLEDPRAAPLFKRLVKQADIVVESSPPGFLGGLGLGFEALREVNPRLTIISVTPFGQEGPYRHYKATHLTLAAMGGWMNALRVPGRDPFPPGVPVALYAAGVYGAIGALAAVAGRRLTGRGTHVDVSCLESVLNLMVFPTLLYQLLGREPSFPNLTFPGPTKCRDGYAAINVLSGDHWQRLCQWTGMDDVLEDPEMANAALRGAHTEELRPRIVAWAKDKTRREIFYDGQQWRLPIGLYSTVEDLLSEQQFQERGYFAETTSNGVGNVSMPGAPYKASATPWELRRPAPALGQHNDEVFRGLLGCSDHEVLEFRRAGVV